MYQGQTRAPRHLTSHQLTALLCFALGCVAPASTFAATPDEGVGADRTTVSVLGPMMGIEIGLGVVPPGNFSVAGVEASYRAPARWMMGLGLIYLTDGNEFKPTIHLRGGYAFHLHGVEPGSTRRGFGGFVTPFAGYRYAVRPFPERDSYSDIYHTHNVQLGSSYELQWGKRLAALFRITAAYDIPFASRVEALSSTPPEYEGGIGLYTSLGVAYNGLFSRR